MKLTTVLSLIIGMTGFVSWSIVIKYRKSWGQDSGVTYICKRLIAERNAEGWMLVLSQIVTVLSGAYLLYLVNVR
ncbi:hypothetical protein [Luteibacter sp. SG786]|uniref:hypothetical protein n=1 Tax=Luteibacter sp. SG786 TaxID=2587130 RepID=UPI0014224D20|nr:hypothetical protein [Luteibacter sp. SG786]NII55137.1 hypothetical protein [Luteibacter sp. SG786]